ncbi:hypothetical protein GCM10020256_55280 [Streptomyces thermocoprophilus]
MTDARKASDGTSTGRATAAPSRRALIGWGGAGLALGAAAAGGAVAVTRTGDDVAPAAAEVGGAVEFHGAHQAGIATPPYRTGCTSPRSTWRPTTARRSYGC